jgi:acetate kinase
MHTDPILSVNGGSSSLKLGYFARQDSEEQAIYEALIDGIGRPKGELQIRDRAGEVVHSRTLDSPTAS